MENVQFRGFAPDESLVKKAETTLDRVMDGAPNEFNATITIEQQPDQFRCKLEVVSEHFSLALETQHRFAAIALDKAELAALRKFDRWRGGRFSRKNDSPIRAPFRIAN